MHYLGRPDAVAKNPTIPLLLSDSTAHHRGVLTSTPLVIRMILTPRATDYYTRPLRPSTSMLEPYLCMSLTGSIERECHLVSGSVETVETHVTHISPIIH